MASNTAGTRFELRHLPALDGLRGLAVIGVLLFHAGPLIGFKGGYLGVDLFFVLSGFLITSLLLRERSANGANDLREFWRRRARRLLPAMFALFVVVGLYTAFAAPPYERDTIRGDMWWTIFYSANWHAIWDGSGYWELFNAPSPLEHTWSLAIEEQFYLVWPLLLAGLFWAFRNSIKRVFVFVAGALALSVVWALVLFAQSGDVSRVYLGTDTRAPAILFGALLAFALVVVGPSRSKRARVLIEALGLVSMVGLLIAWRTVSGQSELLYKGILPACGLAAMLVILAAVHPTPGPISRVLSFRPLRGLGLISYGLYLYHWPIFVWFQRERVSDGWTRFILEVALSIGIAVVSYRFLEKPIRNDGIASARLRVLAPVAAACAILVVFVATMGGTTRSVDVTAELASADGDSGGVVIGGELSGVGIDGSPMLIPESALGDPNPSATGVTTTLAPGQSETGIVTSTTSPRVATTIAISGPMQRPVGRPGRLLVVGDSVASGMAESLGASATANGLIIDNLAKYGCELYAGDGRRLSDDGSIDDEGPHCVSWRAHWMTEVEKFKPDAVLLLWGGALFGQRFVDGDWRGYCDPAFQAAFRDSLGRSLDGFASGGATVFVAIPAYPNFPFFGEEVGPNHGCEVAAMRDVVASRPPARAVRLDEWTCPSEGCSDERDGVKLREDGVHYDVESGGRAMAAAWLITQIFAA